MPSEIAVKISPCAVLGGFSFAARRSALDWNRGEPGQAKPGGGPDYDGRAVLERLIDRADVVSYNKLPAQAERLDVAPAQVHARNDCAVVCAVTAYGGIKGGGWEHRPAYDPVIQAVSGVMARYGGLDTPAVHGVAAPIDYFTGFSGAFAALVGLLARERGARDVVGRTSPRAGRGMDPGPVRDWCARGGAQRDAGERFAPARSSLSGERRLALCRGTTQRLAAPSRVDGERAGHPGAAGTRRARAGSPTPRLAMRASA
jgi:hypothetical protein